MTLTKIENMPEKYMSMLEEAQKENPELKSSEILVQSLLAGMMVARLMSKNERTFMGMISELVDGVNAGIVKGIEMGIENPFGPDEPDSDE